MFKVGDRVFDIQFGWGFIVKISSNIEVRFEEYMGMFNYNINGSRVHQSSNRTLYHHDYTPKAILSSHMTECNTETLTKREQFSGMAMQGYLAANCEFGEYDLARYSIKCADALIKALNESKTS